MSHGYIKLLCMMSHYCVGSIWASIELVNAGIMPVFTREGYLFVESWFFAIFFFEYRNHAKPYLAA